MKVLQVINSLETGGAEKLILESLPLFKEYGITVDLLLLNDKGSPFLRKIKKNHGNLNVHILTSYSLYNPINLFKIIHFFKYYDIVHANLFPSIYFVAIAKIISHRKSKLILTEHATFNRRFNNFFFRKINNVIYNFYDKIITISQGVDKNTKNYTNLPSEKIQLIYNGINISAITNSKASQDTKILKFMGNSCKLIIQVSRFQAQKDQATLIKAISLLPRHVKLLLIGDGELKKECQHLADELKVSDRVNFLGVRMDVPELLKLADIVVLSTRYEGLSLSSIEGLASGKPFIGSDVAGLTEVVENAGLLFPQGDDVILAAIIEQLLGDRVFYKKTAAACVNRAASYDIRHMVEGYCNVYKSLK